MVGGAFNLKLLDRKLIQETGNKTENFCSNIMYIRLKMLCLLVELLSSNKKTE